MLDFFAQFSADEVQYEAACQEYNASAKAEEGKTGGKVQGEKHTDELLGLCSCLHFILFHLNDRWRGLHHMVLARLRKSGLTEMSALACLP